MKKFGFLIFVIALIVGSIVAGFVNWGKTSAKLFNFEFNVRGVRGNGNLQSESRDVREFRAVDVSGVFDVEIVAQKDFDVRVEADENLLQYIRTEVNGGVLEISTSKRIKSSSGLKVLISAPDIEKLDVSGVAKVSVSNLRNSALNLDSSGASKINLSGMTDKLIIDVSGASNIEAIDLKTRSATVDASGASKISIFATESIRADASGASKITYTGGATDVLKKASGASSISEK